jgi:DNA-binding GntR family transcriptional regulator
MGSADNIAALVRVAIGRGEHRHGERLKESMLTERYKVSRTIAREALSILEADGLVVRTPNAGSRIVEPSGEDLAHALDFHVAIVCTAVRRLCQDEDQTGMLTKLKEFIRLTELAVAENNPGFVDEISTRFIRSIMEASGNPYLIEGDKKVRYLLEPFLAAIIKNRFFGEKDVAGFLIEGPKIIDAIEQRNALLAEFIIREYYTNFRK